MHAVGLHSALAIKRQRKRRDEHRRSRERRHSSHSGESGLTSPRASTVSLDQNVYYKRKLNTKKRSRRDMVDSKVVTSIGMLHIGVVFLVSGIFLLVSGLLSSDIGSFEMKSLKKCWNELTAVGLFLMILGCFLILLNSAIAKKEENELEQYVQRQLTRSKSGHRLERDAETGGLTTKHDKYVKKINTNKLSFYTFDQSENEIQSLSKEENSTSILPHFRTHNDDKSKQSTILLERITEEDVTNNRFEHSTPNSSKYIKS